MLAAGAANARSSPSGQAISQIPVLAPKPELPRPRKRIVPIPPPSGAAVLTEVPEFVDMLGRSRRADRLIRVDRQ